MILNKYIFERNFMSSVHDLTGGNVRLDDIFFLVNPISEINKKYNTRDEYLRRWLLSDENLNGRRMSFNEVVLLLTGMEPYFPFWIKIYPMKRTETLNIIELDVSLRFRSPKVILSQGLIYPPFIIQGKSLKKNE
ncbi:TPA: hypothetical protein J1442_004811 [Escherichia coli]|uniref:Uncharacterized protein n=1 Tax=Escherichia coli TaxID=562 RepID=A0A1Y2XGS8_ECOLX|nr:hypothetical protein [Escherichia coli]EEQ3931354.1 hypothetical protein [Escherichia coli]EEQ9667112.1 hypothetical protein [Escherichia coli]EEW0065510.1 hypothetical protein [Escherichia coli]EFA1709771.1 hypothetical protein [Escherichia coli]EFC7122233.1 hypothetical protein [Escherichia coli]